MNLILTQDYSEFTEFYSQEIFFNCIVLYRPQKVW